MLLAGTRRMVVKSMAVQLVGPLCEKAGPQMVLAALSFGDTLMQNLGKLPCINEFPYLVHNCLVLHNSNSTIVHLKPPRGCRDVQGHYDLVGTVPPLTLAYEMRPCAYVSKFCCHNQPLMSACWFLWQTGKEWQAVVMFK